MRKLLIYSVAILFTSGCATSMVSIPPTYDIDLTQSPATGTATTKELGETLVSALCSRQTDSWRISDYGFGEDNQTYSLAESFKITPFLFPSQVLKPIGKSKDGVPFFVATQGTEGIHPWRKPVTGTPTQFNIFCEKNGELYVNCVPLGTPFEKSLKALDLDGWAEKDIYVDLSYPSLQQELIYNGRIDNDIKFVYRELATQLNGGAIMRSPFQQDVQYDLNESDVIGFKGMRLKVIEATNTKINYEVIRHFPIDCAQQI